GSKTSDNQNAATHEAAKTDSDASKDESTSADPGAVFKALFGQWQAALTDVAQLQANLRITTPEGREALTPQYSAAVVKPNAILGALQAATEKAFSAGDNDPEIGKLLMTIAVGDVRKDNYPEALRLAKLLIDHKYPDKNVYRIAATAAFSLM